MLTNFEKLKTGLIMRSIEKETEEPENIAIGQVSKELRFFQRHTEYAMEISRVLEELQITVTLIAGLKSGTEEITSEGINREDLLLYYQGAFFNLVHQMKDKILQLVNLITEESVPEKPSQERDVSLTVLLKNKSNTLESLGVLEELEFWNQENPDSPVAIVLRRRRNHHHRISRLRYNENVLNLGFVKTMESLKTKEILTPYGLERIKNIKKESTERLFSDIYEKTRDTLKAIEDNLDRIAEALIAYCKLSAGEERIKEIYDKHSQMLDSFGVTNKTSVKKIPETHRQKLKELVELITNAHRNKVESIYLVGSVGRGEYEDGYSDVNIFVVVSSDKEAVQKDIISHSPFNGELSLLVFNKEDFLSEHSKKYRFIVFADGMLLYGKDLVKKEKFPKGLGLAFLLNNDILEKLEAAESWIENNLKASPLDISKKSKKLAKDIINFVYGIVISNKPQYTSSREERIASMNKMYPENSNLLNTLTEVAKYGVGTFENFRNLIIGFKPIAITNLKKMREVISKLGKQ